ncbi:MULTISPECIES: hypothetical protein [unclassified Chamaesiphon]|nr:MULTISPECIES: hypothetical protein [unclassified Chamaesiphon]
MKNANYQKVERSGVCRDLSWATLYCYSLARFLAGVATPIALRWQSG